MKTYKKFLLGIGGVVAAAAVAATVTDKINRFVVSAALDRKKPKQMENGKPPSNMTISRELAEKLEEFSDKLKSENLETVEITARDGEKLVGHWYGNKNAQRVIIAMHGWRSSWAHDFGAIADFWHDSGCSVLYAEQRGQGRSGGEYMGFGMIERYDCLDWINFVNKKMQKSLPVYLAGISMGASTVLMTAGFHLPKNVCGIIADCGFTSAHEIWKHVVDSNTVFFYGMHSKAVDNLCKKKISVGTQDYSTLDAMKNCRVPVLFIHGTDDTFVPIEMTYENYKACIAKKRLFIVPGAVHAASYLTDKNGYEKNVKDFWNSFDNRALL